MQKSPINTKYSEFTKGYEQTHQTLLSSGKSDWCTGAYIGRDVSAEGTTVIARSADGSNGFENTMFKVVPAKDEPGQCIVDNDPEQKNFTIELPNKTCKYTTMKGGDHSKPGPWFDNCINEYGVATTGTITTGVCDEYAKLDPVKPAGDGLREANMVAIPITHAKTAHQAVEIMIDYIQRYGCQHYETAMYMDKNEAWYLEMYGGFTYCAMKMPTDCVAVFGNHIMIGWVDFDDTEQYIFSPKLKENLDMLKSVVIDDSGRYHLARSIDAEGRTNESNMRDWRGHQLFAPSTCHDYDINTFYPLFYKPDRKISILELMNLYRDRYENTRFDMELKGNECLRPIGVTRQSQIYLTQCFTDLPDQCCHVQWMCSSNAEEAPFIPTYSGVTKVFDKYDIPDPKNYAIVDSFPCLCQKICALAATSRYFLRDGCQLYIRILEKLMFDEIMLTNGRVVDAFNKSSEDGEAFVDDFCTDMAKTQYENLEMLYEELAYRHMWNIDDRATSDKRLHFYPNIKVEDFCSYYGFKYQINEKSRGNSECKIINSENSNKKYVFAEILIQEDQSTIFIDGSKKNIQNGLFFKDKTAYINTEICKLLEVCNI